MIFLGQAEIMTSMSDVLLGLGLPGVVMLALGLAVRALYNRIDEDRAYHRNRADKLEDELRALNITIRDEYVRGLAAAADAMGDFVRANQQQPPSPRGR